MACMPNRLGNNAAHHAGDSSQGVEPRPDQLLHHERRTAALLAQDPSWQVIVLDLRGGEAATAELVLESLQTKTRVRPLRDEAGDPGIGLRESEEDLKDRVSTEPLMAGQLEPAVPDRFSDGRVGAQIRAALLLGHDHPGLSERLVIWQ